MGDVEGLRAKMPSDSGASATQLSILLSSATSAIDEEFKRSERLDAKSRNQITITGSFFTVAQAIVVGLINGSLGGSDTHPASSFIPWLSAAGGVAALAMIGALVVSHAAWKLRNDETLVIDTIRDYIAPALEGNPRVGVNLVEAYSDIAEQRRSNNTVRANALERATIACSAAIAFISIELVLAFIAAAVQ
jgi:hypothetical protein